jgi:hypothetical protein
MLHVDTPFPEVGSFALYQDPDLPMPERRSELARIIERGVSVALISLPLRLGAGGNKRVPLADLIDGTPLTKAEERELTDLDRSLRSRVRNRSAVEARVKALRDRAIWMMCLRSERAKLAAAQAEQPQRRVA